MSGKTLQRYAVGISLVTLCIAIWLTSFIWPLQPESINSPSFGQKLPDVNDAWNTTSNHTSKTDSTDVGYYHHHHHRRDPHLVMSYAYAICKGGLLWQRVEDALAGRAPAGPHFTDQDFNNGWTDHPLPRPAKIKEHWLDAFVSFAHNRPPRAEEIVTLNAVQDKSFRVETGASVNVCLYLQMRDHARTYTRIHPYTIHPHCHIANTLNPDTNEWTLPPQLHPRLVCPPRSRSEQPKKSPQRYA